MLQWIENLIGELEANCEGVDLVITPMEAKVQLRINREKPIFFDSVEEAKKRAQFIMERRKIETPKKNKRNSKRR